MSVKFIALTQRLLENTSYYEVREALSVEWGDFFNQYLQDFLPLPLSYEIPFSTYAKSLGDSLSGVLLSGGNDLSSLNQNPLSSVRDEYEEQIITHCLQYDVPLLGICRGAQMIAEYFGAKLEPIEGHIGSHQVFDIRKDSRFVVNSFHNYGIKDLPNSLEALVMAQDYSIEAFKHKQKPIFALMWHIEREGGMRAQGEQNQSFDEWLKIVTIKKEKE